MLTDKRNLEFLKWPTPILHKTKHLSKYIKMSFPKKINKSGIFRTKMRIGKKYGRQNEAELSSSMRYRCKKY
jgi:hypothetical protein